MARAMEITTPLGDVLLFHTMHAREELGRVGECRLELLSLDSNINLNSILGQNVTVRLALQNAATRYFNGYVTRFSQGDVLGKYHRYHATVHPWLWFLSRTADCRIFQDKTVPQILEKIFSEHPTASFKNSLTASYPRRTYCVQYRETDLSFVSRLMEQEGIYFYFTHTDGKHTMVLADSYRAHAAFQNKPVPFIAPENPAAPDVERVSSWTLTCEVQPGVYVHDDYDFERPTVDLTTKKVVTRNYSPSNYEVYDYPGEYQQKADGEAAAAVRLDEYAAQFEMVQATTNVRTLSAGSLFTLDKSPRADQNREHLVVSATYDLEFSDYEGLPNRTIADYRCGFVAMSSAQQFRSQRLTARPAVQGPQTAVVVGPAGEEIHTDKYGRVKVLFHWDREGEKAGNENSSCWVRVSQPWAGKSWGGILIPRVGQEVIVDFLEGDPDQPIITGRVYNGEQMPPYPLPANKTQSGIRSRTSPGGSAADFNEIRFEDKPGAEQLLIHAERNQDTEVGHDRTDTVKNDESIAVGGNRTESVAKNESISIGKSRATSVAENESITIGKDQTISASGNRTVSVGRNESISVGANRTEQIGATASVTIGRNRQATIGDDDALKVGKKLLVEAGEQMTFVTGAASITLKKDGTIVIKGKDISIEGSGQITVKAAGDVALKGSRITQN